MYLAAGSPKCSIHSYLFNAMHELIVHNIYLATSTHGGMVAWDSTCKRLPEISKEREQAYDMELSCHFPPYNVVFLCILYKDPRRPTMLLTECYWQEHHCRTTLLSCKSLLNFILHRWHLKWPPLVSAIIDELTETFNVTSSLQLCFVYKRGFTLIAFVSG